MSIQQYIDKVTTRFKAVISSKHTYRGDLEALIRKLAPNIEITKEPKGVTYCGNPNYVITSKNIPVGYIKDKDINSKSYNEQFNRYKKALNNLIFTDYLKFQFYQHGELAHEIEIGKIEIE